MLRAASLAVAESSATEKTTHAPRSRSWTSLPARFAPMVQCSIM